MGFTDPQSVTIAAVPVSLPRVSSLADGVVFSSNDSLVKMSISSSYGKRTRRTLRLEHNKIATDPLNTAQNIPYFMTFYVVADVPKSGYTVPQQKEIVDALVVYLTASSGARVTQWLGGEN